MPRKPIGEKLEKVVSTKIGSRILRLSQNTPGYVTMKIN